MEEILKGEILKGEDGFLHQAVIRHMIGVQRRRWLPEDGFPFPFLMVAVGYTIILMIDKILFDTHAIFEDGHDHGHGHKDEARHSIIREQLRQSIHEAGGKNFDNISDIQLENAIRKSLAGSVKKSNAFAN